MLNEDKFIGKADTYAKYRPSYPSEFINYLYSKVHFNENSVIADVGSGTGKFTELLLKKGSLVYGIEPNVDMRSVAEKALSCYGNFRSVKSSAESVAVPDKTFDFITVAQAFHWFDREKFKSECHRLLKDRGKVVLVWNTRDNNDELVKANYMVNQKFCPGFKGFSHGMTEDKPGDYGDFFKNGMCEHEVFRNELKFDENSFIGRNLSSSYAPKENDTNYLLYIDALKELFRKYSKAGFLTMANITKSYVGEV